ncbi:MAG: hypothetical protein WC484_00390 [Candidatus Omnitrophota bacterium]
MISWQTHNFKPWLRTVALLTVCVFTFTSVVWDGGVKAYAAAPKPENLTPAEIFKADVALSLIDRPDLPDSYGTIKSFFKGNRQQIVLHIQDAHVNEEAQRNIANILRYFSEKYQLGLVNLEGASGELYTELFSFFPNKEARRNVADYFLREGRLTGPEYLAIVEKPAMTLYGVEDKELYEENRKAYVDALQFKARDEKILAGLNKVLEGISRFVFPEEMRELIRRRAAFQEGGPELTSYVRYLVELGRKHNIALDEYPGMHSLIQLVDLEKKVDFDKAEKETDELINDLKRVLSREKLSRFLTNTVHFRMKKMKRAAYYGYLQDEIQGVSVVQSGGEDLTAKYSNVIAYIRYMKLYDAIDVSIFDEIEFLERTVKNKLFTTPEQVKLDHILRIYDIYCKMFDFTLTKQDAEFYYTYQDEFKAETFSNFLNPLMSKYHFTYGLPSQVKTLDQDLPRVERFYKAALERDQVLVERAVEKIFATGEKMSAIITGGFHTPGIEKYLREQDISYIVVAPRITKTIDKKKESALYDAALRETPLPIEKVLTEAFLQPKTGVLNDPRFQLSAKKEIPSVQDVASIPQDLNVARVEVRWAGLESIFLNPGKTPAETVAGLRSELRKLPTQAGIDFGEAALAGLEEAQFDPQRRLWDLAARDAKGNIPVVIRMDSVGSRGEVTITGVRGGRTTWDMPNGIRYIFAKVGDLYLPTKLATQIVAQAPLRATGKERLGAIEITSGVIAPKVTPVAKPTTQEEGVPFGDEIEKAQQTVAKRRYDDNLKALNAFLRVTGAPDGFDISKSDELTADEWERLLSSIGFANKFNKLEKAWQELKAQGHQEYLTRKMIVRLLQRSSADKISGVPAKIAFISGLNEKYFAKTNIGENKGLKISEVTITFRNEVIERMMGERLQELQQKAFDKGAPIGANVGLLLDQTLTVKAAKSAAEALKATESAKPIGTPKEQLLARLNELSKSQSHGEDFLHQAAAIDLAPGMNVLAAARTAYINSQYNPISLGEANVVHMLSAGPSWGNGLNLSFLQESDRKRKIEEAAALKWDRDASADGKEAFVRHFLEVGIKKLGEEIAARQRQMELAKSATTQPEPTAKPTATVKGMLGWVSALAQKHSQDGSPVRVREGFEGAKGVVEKAKAFFGVNSIQHVEYQKMENDLPAQQWSKAPAAQEIAERLRMRGRLSRSEFLNLLKMLHQEIQPGSVMSFEQWLDSLTFSQWLALQDRMAAKSRQLHKQIEHGRYAHGIKGHIKRIFEMAVEETAKTKARVEALKQTAARGGGIGAWVLYFIKVAHIMLLVFPLRVGLILPLQDLEPWLWGPFRVRLAELLFHRNHSFMSVPEFAKVFSENALELFSSSDKGPQTVSAALKEKVNSWQDFKKAISLFYERLLTHPSKAVRVSARVISTGYYYIPGGFVEVLNNRISLAIIGKYAGGILAPLVPGALAKVTIGSLLAGGFGPALLILGVAILVFFIVKKMSGDWKKAAVSSGILLAVCGALFLITGVNVADFVMPFVTRLPSLITHIPLIGPALTAVFGFTVSAVVKEFVRSIGVMGVFHTSIMVLFITIPRVLPGYLNMQRDLRLAAEAKRSGVLHQSTISWIEGNVADQMKKTGEKEVPVGRYGPLDFPVVSQAVSALVGKYLQTKDQASRREALARLAEAYDDLRKLSAVIRTQIKGQDLSMKSLLKTLEGILTDEGVGPTPESAPIPQFTGRDQLVIIRRAWKTMLTDPYFWKRCANQFRGMIMVGVAIQGVVNWNATIDRGISYVTGTEFHGFWQLASAVELGKGESIIPFGGAMHWGSALVDSTESALGVSISDSIYHAESQFLHAVGIRTEMVEYGARGLGMADVRFVMESEDALGRYRAKNLDTQEAEAQLAKIKSGAFSHLPREGRDNENFRFNLSLRNAEIARQIASVAEEGPEGRNAKQILEPKLKKLQDLAKQPVITFKPHELENAFMEIGNIIRFAEIAKKVRQEADQRWPEPSVEKAKFLAAAQAQIKLSSQEPLEVAAKVLPVSVSEAPKVQEKGLLASVLKFIPKTMPVATIGVSQKTWQSFGKTMANSLDSNRVPNEVVMAGMGGPAAMPGIFQLAKGGGEPRISPANAATRQVFKDINARRPYITDRYWPTFQPQPSYKQITPIQTTPEAVPPLKAPFDEPLKMPVVKTNVVPSATTPISVTNVVPGKVIAPTNAPMEPAVPTIAPEVPLLKEKPIMPVSTNASMISQKLAAVSAGLMNFGAGVLEFFSPASAMGHGVSPANEATRQVFKDINARRSYITDRYWPSFQPQPSYKQITPVQTAPEAVPPFKAPFVEPLKVPAVTPVIPTNREMVPGVKTNVVPSATTPIEVTNVVPGKVIAPTNAPVKPAVTPEVPVKTPAMPLPSEKAPGPKTDIFEKRPVLVAMAGSSLPLGIFAVDQAVGKQPAVLTRTPEASITTVEMSDQVKMREEIGFFIDEQLPEIEDPVIRQQAAERAEELEAKVLSGEMKTLQEYNLAINQIVNKVASLQAVTQAKPAEIPLAEQPVTRSVPAVEYDLRAAQKTFAGSQRNLLDFLKKSGRRDAWQAAYEQIQGGVVNGDTREDIVLGFRRLSRDGSDSIRAGLSKILRSQEDTEELNRRIGDMIAAQKNKETFQAEMGAIPEAIRKQNAALTAMDQRLAGLKILGFRRLLEERAKLDPVSPEFMAKNEAINEYREVILKAIRDGKDSAFPKSKRPLFFNRDRPWNSAWSNKAALEDRIASGDVRVGPAFRVEIERLATEAGVIVKPQVAEPTAPVSAEPESPIVQPAVAGPVAAAPVVTETGKTSGVGAALAVAGVPGAALDTGTNIVASVLPPTEAELTTSLQNLREFFKNTVPVDSPYGDEMSLYMDELAGKMRQDGLSYHDAIKMAQQKLKDMEGAPETPVAMPPSTSEEHAKKLARDLEFFSMTSFALGLGSEVVVQAIEGNFKAPAVGEKAGPVKPTEEVTTGRAPEAQIAIDLWEQLKDMQGKLIGLKGQAQTLEKQGRQADPKARKDLESKMAELEDKIKAARKETKAAVEKSQKKMRTKLASENREIEKLQAEIAREKAKEKGVDTNLGDLTKKLAEHARNTQLIYQSYSTVVRPEPVKGNVQDWFRAAKGQSHAVKQAEFDRDIANTIYEGWSLRHRLFTADLDLSLNLLPRELAVYQNDPTTLLGNDVNSPLAWTSDGQLAIPWYQGDESTRTYTYTYEEYVQIGTDSAGNPIYAIKTGTRSAVNPAAPPPSTPASQKDVDKLYGKTYEEDSRYSRVGYWRVGLNVIIDNGGIPQTVGNASENMRDAASSQKIFASFGLKPMDLQELSEGAGEEAKVGNKTGPHILCIGFMSYHSARYNNPLNTEEPDLKNVYNGATLSQIMDSFAEMQREVEKRLKRPINFTNPNDTALVSYFARLQCYDPKMAREALNERDWNAKLTLRLELINLFRSRQRRISEAGAKRAQAQLDITKDDTADALMQKFFKVAELNDNLRATNDRIIRLEALLRLQRRMPGQAVGTLTQNQIEDEILKARNSLIILNTDRDQTAADIVRTSGFGTDVAMNVPWDQITLPSIADVFMSEGMPNERIRHSMSFGIAEVELKMAERATWGGLNATLAVPQVTWDILRSAGIWSLGDIVTIDLIRADLTWQISALHDQKVKDAEIESEAEKFATRIRTLYENRLLIRQAIPAQKTFLERLKSAYATQQAVVESIKSDPNRGFLRDLSLAQAYVNLDGLEKDVHGAEMALMILEQREREYTSLDETVQKTIEKFKKEHGTAGKAKVVEDKIEAMRENVQNGWLSTQGSAISVEADVQKGFWMADHFADNVDPAQKRANKERILRSVQAQRNAEVESLVAVGMMRYDVLNSFFASAGFAMGTGYTDRNGKDVTQIEPGFRFLSANAWFRATLAAAPGSGIRAAQRQSAKASTDKYRGRERAVDGENLAGWINNIKRGAELVRLIEQELRVREVEYQKAVKLANDALALTTSSQEFTEKMELSAEQRYPWADLARIKSAEANVEQARAKWDAARTNLADVTVRFMMFGFGKNVDLKQIIQGETASDKVVQAEAKSKETSIALETSVATLLGEKNKVLLPKIVSRIESLIALDRNVDEIVRVPRDAGVRFSREDLKMIKTQVQARIDAKKAEEAARDAVSGLVTSPFSRITDPNDRITQNGLEDIRAFGPKFLDLRVGIKKVREDLKPWIGKMSKTEKEQAEKLDKLNERIARLQDDLKIIIDGVEGRRTLSDAERLTKLSMLFRNYLHVVNDHRTVLGTLAHEIDAIDKKARDGSLRADQVKDRVSIIVTYLRQQDQLKKEFSAINEQINKVSKISAIEEILRKQDLIQLNCEKALNLVLSKWRTGISVGYSAGFDKYGINGQIIPVAPVLDILKWGADQVLDRGIPFFGIGDFLSHFVGADRTAVENEIQRLMSDIQGDLILAKVTLNSLDRMASDESERIGNLNEQLTGLKSGLAVAVTSWMGHRAAVISGSDIGRINAITDDWDTAKTEREFGEFLELRVKTEHVKANIRDKWNRLRSSGVFLPLKETKIDTADSIKDEFTTGRGTRAGRVSDKEKMGRGEESLEALAKRSSQAQIAELEAKLAYLEAQVADRGQSAVYSDSFMPDDPLIAPFAYPLVYETGVDTYDENGEWKDREADQSSMEPARVLNTTTDLGQLVFNFSGRAYRARARKADAKVDDVVRTRVEAIARADHDFQSQVAVIERLERQRKEMTVEIITGIRNRGSIFWASRNEQNEAEGEAFAAAVSYMEARNVLYEARQRLYDETGFRIERLPSGLGIVPEGSPAMPFDLGELTKALQTQGGSEGLLARMQVAGMRNSKSAQPENELIAIQQTRKAIHSKQYTSVWSRVGADNGGFRAEISYNIRLAGGDYGVNKEVNKLQQAKVGDQITEAGQALLWEMDKNLRLLESSNEQLKNADLRFRSLLMGKTEAIHGTAINAISGDIGLGYVRRLTEAFFAVISTERAHNMNWMNYALFCQRNNIDPKIFGGIQLEAQAEVQLTNAEKVVRTNDFDKAKTALFDRYQVPAEQRQTFVDRWLGREGASSEVFKDYVQGKIDLKDVLEEFEKFINDSWKKPEIVDLQTLDIDKFNYIRPVITQTPERTEFEPMAVDLLKALGIDVIAAAGEASKQKIEITKINNELAVAQASYKEISQRVADSKKAFDQAFALKLSERLGAKFLGFDIRGPGWLLSVIEWREGLKESMVRWAVTKTGWHWLEGLKKWDLVRFKNATEEGGSQNAREKAEQELVKLQNEQASAKQKMKNAQEARKNVRERVKALQEIEALRVLMPKILGANADVANLTKTLGIKGIQTRWLKPLITLAQYDREHGLVKALFGDDSQLQAFWEQDLSTAFLADSETTDRLKAAGINLRHLGVLNFVARHVDWALENPEFRTRAKVRGPDGKIHTINDSEDPAQAVTQWFMELLTSLPKARELLQKNYRAFSPSALEGIPDETIRRKMRQGIPLNMNSPDEAGMIWGFAYDAKLRGLDLTEKDILNRKITQEVDLDGDRKPEFISQSIYANVLEKSFPDYSLNKRWRPVHDLRIDADARHRGLDRSARFRTISEGTLDREGNVVLKQIPQDKTVEQARTRATQAGLRQSGVIAPEYDAATAKLEKHRWVTEKKEQGQTLTDEEEQMILSQEEEAKLDEIVMRVDRVAYVVLKFQTLMVQSIPESQEGFKAIEALIQSTQLKLDRERGVQLTSEDEKKILSVKAEEEFRAKLLNDSFLNSPAARPAREALTRLMQLKEELSASDILDYYEIILTSMTDVREGIRAGRAMGLLNMFLYGSGYGTDIEREDWIKRPLDMRLKEMMASLEVTFNLSRSLQALSDETSWTGKSDLYNLVGDEKGDIFGLLLAIGMRLSQGQDPAFKGILNNNGSVADEGKAWTLFYVLLPDTGAESGARMIDQYLRDTDETGEYGVKNVRSRTGDVMSMARVLTLKLAEEGFAPEGSHSSTISPSGILDGANEILSRRLEIYRASRKEGIALDIPRDDLDAEDLAIQELRKVVAPDQDSLEFTKAFATPYYTWVKTFLDSKAVVGEMWIERLQGYKNHPETMPKWMGPTERDRMLNFIQKDLQNEKSSIQAAKAWVTQQVLWGFARPDKMESTKKTIMDRVQYEMYLQAANMLYHVSEGDFDVPILRNGLSQKSEKNVANTLVRAVLKEVTGKEISEEVLKNITEAQFVEVFNRILAMPDFFSRVAKQIDVSRLSEDIRNILEKAETAEETLSDVEIRSLNRALLEQLYAQAIKARRISAPFDFVVSGWPQVLSDGKLAAFSRVVLLRGKLNPNEAGPVLENYANLLRTDGLESAALAGREIPGNPYAPFVKDRVEATVRWLNRLGPIKHKNWKSVDEAWVRANHKGWASEKIFGQLSRILEGQSWGQGYLPDSPDGVPRYLYDLIEDAALMDAVIFVIHGEFISNETLTSLVRTERGGFPKIPLAGKAVVNLSWINQFRNYMLNRFSNSDLIENPESGSWNFLLNKYSSQQFHDIDIRPLGNYTDKNGHQYDLDDIRKIRAGYRSVYRTNIGDENLEDPRCKEPLHTLWFSDKLGKLEEKLANAGVPGEDIVAARDSFMIAMQEGRAVFMRAVYGSSSDLSILRDRTAASKPMRAFLDNWAEWLIVNYKTQMEREKAELNGERRNFEYEIQSRRELIDAQRKNRLKKITAKFNEGNVAYKDILLNAFGELSNVLKKLNATEPALRQFPLKFSNQDLLLSAGEILHTGYSPEETLLVHGYILPEVCVSEGLSRDTNVDALDDVNLMYRIKHRAREILDRAEATRPDHLVEGIVEQLVFFQEVHEREILLKKQFASVAASAGRRLYPGEGVDSKNVMYESRKAFDDEMQRIAENSANRLIPQRFLEDWLKLAETMVLQVKAAGNKEADLRTILYGADSLLKVGLAAQPQPRVWNDREIEAVFNDTVGWIFDQSAQKDSIDLFRLVPQVNGVPITGEKTALYSRQAYESRLTRERKIRERWTQQPGLREKMRTQALDRIKDLARYGAITPLDLYELMNLTRTQYQEILDQAYQAAQKKVASKDLPKPHDVPPLTVLMTMDLQNPDKVRRIGFVDILFPEMAGKDFLRIDAQTGGQIAAVARRTDEQFADHYSSVPDSDRSWLSKRLTFDHKWLNASQSKWITFNTDKNRNPFLNNIAVPAFLLAGLIFLFRIINFLFFKTIPYARRIGSRWTETTPPPSPESLVTPPQGSSSSAGTGKEVAGSEGPRSEVREQPSAEVNLTPEQLRQQIMATRIAHVRIALFKFLVNFTAIFMIFWTLACLSPFSVASSAIFLILYAKYHRRLYSQWAYNPIAYLTGSLKYSLPLLGMGGIVALISDLVVKTAIWPTIVWFFAAHPVFLVVLAAWALMAILMLPRIDKSPGVMNYVPDKEEQKLFDDARAANIMVELDAIREIGEESEAGEARIQALQTRLDAERKRGDAKAEGHIPRDKKTVMLQVSRVVYDELDEVVDVTARQLIANNLSSSRSILLVNGPEIGAWYVKKQLARDGVSSNSDEGKKILAAEGGRSVDEIESKEDAKAGKAKFKYTSEEVMRKVRDRLELYWKVLGYTDENGVQHRGVERLQVWYRGGGRKPVPNILILGALFGWGEDGLLGRLLGQISSRGKDLSNLYWDFKIFGRRILLGPSFIIDEIEKEDKSILRISLFFDGANKPFILAVATPDNDTGFKAYDDNVRNDPELMGQYLPKDNGDGTFEHQVLHTTTQDSGTT